MGNDKAVMPMDVNQGKPPFVTPLISSWLEYI